MHEQLLSVPYIVKVLIGFGMSHTSWVSASDEVGDATVCSGRCVPEDFSGTSIVHGRRPDSKDGMGWVEGAVIEECLMLLHSCVKWCIIFFGPSTERMEEKNGVLVTFLEELFSGVIEEENVAIVKGISDLEGIDN